MTGGHPPQSRVVATVRGIVQGVGFRWFVQREASRLGVVGWVANLPDGSVEVVAEGDEATLDQLVGRLREGPAASDVRRVDVRREPARGTLVSFGIRSGAHRGD
jgi:acylphosphatase